MVALTEQLLNESDSVKSFFRLWRAITQGNKNNTSNALSNFLSHCPHTCKPCVSDDVWKAWSGCTTQLHRGVIGSFHRFHADKSSSVPIIGLHTGCCGVVLDQETFANASINYASSQQQQEQQNLFRKRNFAPYVDIDSRFPGQMCARVLHAFA